GIEGEERKMPSIIIIGAGFGGLGVALELQRHGYHDFVILERANDVGGVWRDNDYPDAGVDTPSPLYSYSFAPKSDWPLRFSMQPDILAYARDVVRSYGLAAKIRFDSEVTDAEFDDNTGQWTVRTADQQVRVADVVVSAVGQLSQPSVPDIPGM